ncbi:STAS domain-containing protein [Nocardia otitidiscaviarum]|uniref:STAS domain-containing protein n=1 Tax=Nocardia otitidiscaviarum TaxID=1823 RepID=UPI002455DE22|nr:STAS domain-containing protein [Nocardia otitidiscaviarum]
MRHDPFAGSVIVHVIGDVDLTTIETMRAGLAAALEATPSGGAVIVEFSQLGYFGSAGLHALADLHQRCRSRGCQLCLVRVPSIVEWMLMTVENATPRFPDVDAALHAIGRVCDDATARPELKGTGTDSARHYTATGIDERDDDPA